VAPSEASPPPVARKRGRPKREGPPPPRKPRPKKVKPPAEEPPPQASVPQVHSRLPSIPTEPAEGLRPGALREPLQPPMSAYDAMVHNWKARQQLQQDAKREMYSRFIQQMFA
jgi:hypothetical protein